ncbi:MAG: sigma-54 dependent transcriptional regulator [Acidobacteriota bacterium]|nr:sigma-54 dependent transcriptional regulator [Acidobacteriota bacterium]
MKYEGEELPTGFVGRSPQIVRIRGQLEKLGPSRTPVLIQGESGTGKEVAARSLFNAFPRGHFVPIDCGSLVGPLMESELFGHARHSFTGAGEAKRGLIELANGGTAFLDEIGDLPLDLQVKLLRVIQEKEFRAVGSLVRMKVDVRIVAATHRNLEMEVKAGRFREDLFHRLNVVRLTLPTLRERKSDIPLLIERFLSLANSRYIVTSDALEAMMNYDWPGNIRELKNCLDRMMALNSGPLLHFAELPTQILYHAHAATSADFSVARAAVASGSPRLIPIASDAGAVVPLHVAERREIEKALVKTKGDRSQAALLLGIGRTTLYRKLKEYGVAEAC